MIEFREVMKTHHRGSTEVPALRGVTGAIPEGSFTFILGPSGSGKSTLLHLVGTLDSPTSGEILVGGESLGMMTSRSRDLYRRDRVGFIFQSFNLLKNLSALDNVLVPFLPRGVSNETRKRAFALLKKVGLGERIDHTPNELSGGEQQRVAIARALLKNPSLILADEPTGELDSVTGAEIISALRELQQEIKATVVIVTHDESLIEPSDHVLRMRDGKLL
ncbi:ABC transporter ATP-binding protein [Calycomorphotria hydatis]|nr:ABC transporter ATP-binding protein [Calycomorphotria hydatis]